MKQNPMNSNDLKLSGFSRKLRVLCSERGSQARLAEAIGMSPGALNHIVNGRQDPSLFQALLIARALGASLDDLTDDEVVEVEAANAMTDGERRLLEIARIVGLEEALRRITMAPPRQAAVESPMRPAPPVDLTPEVEGPTLEDDLAAEERRVRKGWAG